MSVAASDVDNGSNDACGIASLAVSPNTFDCDDLESDNYALDFRGNTGALNLGDVSAVEGQSALTLEAWINVPNNQRFLSFFGKTSNNSNKMTLRMAPADGAFFLEMSNGSSQTWDTDQIYLGKYNEWHHIAMVFDGTQALNADRLRFYLDGVPQTFAVQSGSVPATTPSSGADLVIGAELANGFGAINAIMDEVRVWNVARTQGEIMSNMNKKLGAGQTGLVVSLSLNEGPGSGIAVDKSGNGNNGTLVNLNTTSDWVGGAPSITGGTPVPVSLLVTDVHGNSSSCQTSITIQDNTNPTALCQDLTLSLDANGDLSVAASEVDNGSNDACGIASLALAPNTFDCNDVGSNTVTLTVTDNNGNQSTCTADVTVEDNTNPTALCQDLTLSLDANGDLKRSG